MYMHPQVTGRAQAARQKLALDEERIEVVRGQGEKNMGKVRRKLGMGSVAQRHCNAGRITWAVGLPRKMTKMV